MTASDIGFFVEPLPPIEKPSGVNNCARCGEDAFCSNLGDGRYFVRVRRFSKCREYKQGQRRLVCKTEIIEGEANAIREWNETYGNPPGR